MPNRRFTNVLGRASGVLFRFFFDTPDPSRLHAERAHAVTTGDALRTFFDAQPEQVWIAGKRCFETRIATHVLAWFRLDAAQTHVLVITCVPRTAHIRETTR